jgi:hypothetical protein
MDGNIDLPSGDEDDFYANKKLDGNGGPSMIPNEKNVGFA